MKGSKSLQEIDWTNLGTITTALSTTLGERPEMSSQIFGGRACLTDWKTEYVSFRLAEHEGNSLLAALYPDGSVRILAAGKRTDSLQLGGSTMETVQEDLEEMGSDEPTRLPNLILISMSSGTKYYLDLENVTCSCQSFKFNGAKKPLTVPDRLCKHLRAAMLLFPEYDRTIPVRIAQGVGGVGMPVNREQFDPYLQSFKNILNGLGGLERFDAVGGYRRMDRILDRLEILVCMGDEAWGRMHTYFTGLLGMLKIGVKEEEFHEDRATYIMDQKFLVTVRRASEAEWPFALLFYTGGKRYYLSLLDRATSLGYELTAHGVCHRTDGAEIGGITEEKDIYSLLKLSYVPPYGRG